jgi:CHAP domain
MSNEWWTKAYPGGKMVVPQSMFPRPLYPPDANTQGKKPSVAGPDVEAYKRTVSRAGRWPWQTFDRNFTNGFSHGTGGNVVNTGVAGIQRQMKVSPDTGWIGQQTFNMLASIKIPDGLPHAGQMAMDANAANLIAQAYDLYGGKEPTPPPPTPTPTKTTRQKALDASKTYIGVKEAPPHSNKTQFGAWYGVNGQPWCAIFCTYCFVVDAGGSPSFVKGKNYAYVPYIVSDARNNRNGLSVTNTPMAGDLVCYDWGYDGTFDHVGLFEAWTSGNYFQAIEGNTSSDSSGDQSNGGAVCRKQRSVTSQKTVFVRVAQ